MLSSAPQPAEPVEVDEEQNRRCLLYTSISAKTGEGIGELKDTLEMILRNQKVYLEKIYPYNEAGRIQSIRKYGELLSEEYGEDGITVKAYVPAAIYGQLV